MTNTEISSSTLGKILIKYFPKKRRNHTGKKRKSDKALVYYYYGINYIEQQKDFPMAPHVPNTDAINLELQVPTESRLGFRQSKICF